MMREPDQSPTPGVGATVDLPPLAPETADAPTPGQPLEATIDQPRTERPAGSGSVPPGYEALGELGRGGMGVVYRARDRRLGRVVALKMILAGGHASENELRRFAAEAEAVAALRHPNVVPLYEAGTHDGLPYFTLEFVEGGSLARKAKDGPLPPGDAARMVEQVARGVQYAHSQGVIHRDLKPDNVLLGTDGVPKVTDFGLAKRVDAGDGPTRTGAIMGTPSYMAPEQAAGQKDVGPPADIYALGAMLYRLLTGRPPFQAATPLDTILQVMSTEPVPPSRLLPKLPVDLETICLKCLQKEPTARYATAEALADDLDRFLRGVPITARPVAAWERGWKWVVRHPAWTGLGVASTVAALALVAFFVSRSYQTRLTNTNNQLTDALGQAERLRDRVEEQRLQTEEALQRVERFRYGTLISLADRELAAGDLGRAEELLEDCPAPLRGWEWAYLSGRALVSRKQFKAHTGPVLAVSYSTDGERLAAGAGDGSIRVRDENSWREDTVVIRGHQGPVRAVAFSPDGVFLASAGDDGSVRVWELTNKKDSFQPDKNKPLFREGPAFRHPKPIRALAYSPDGRQLAWAGDDGTVRLWVIGAKEPNEIGRHEGSVRAVAFRPDNARLATAGTDRMVRVWNLADQSSIALGPHPGSLSAVAWRADGEEVSAAVDEPGQPGEVLVWNQTTRKQAQAILGPSGGMLGIARHDDGRLVATCRDGTIRYWDRGGVAGIILRGPPPTTAPAIRPDGKNLAVGNGEANAAGQVTLWDLSPRPEDRVIEAHLGGTGGIQFTPDGERLVSAGMDGLVKLWNVTTGKKISVFPGHHGPVAGVAVSPDQLLLASAGRDGTVQVWDIPTGQGLPGFGKHAGPVSAVAFDPEGNWLVSVGADGGIVWNATSGKPMHAFGGSTGPLAGVAVSPDGRRAATAGADRLVRVWDASNGAEIALCKGHTAGALAVAYSPDGKRLASGGMDKTVRVWDAATGKRIHVLAGHPAEVRAITFDPDGKRIVSAGADGTVRFWDAESGVEVGVLKAHPRGATGVAFGSGGRLAASTADGGLKVWEAVKRPPGGFDQK